MSITSERLGMYRKAGILLIDELDRQLDEWDGFPDQPTWGYAFTLLAALMKHPAIMPSSLAAKALYHLKQQDRTNSNYSWEFVIFAMQHSKRINKLSDIVELASYREKGTRMFNWFLLRNVNRLLCGKFTWFDRIKLRIARYLYTSKEGLILDEFKTRSLQYHAFCLFLIAELSHIYPHEKWLVDWLLRGTDVAVDMIMLDGTALHIGRGQEQIFGYASLIYALEFVNKHYRKIPEHKLQAIHSRVLSFQRRDGSFPLVLRKQIPEAAQVSFSLNHPSGWYGYNTLYDYQPFLAYCLLSTGALSE